MSTPEQSPICLRGSWDQSRFRLRPLSGQRQSARRSHISWLRQGALALYDAAQSYSTLMLVDRIRGFGLTITRMLFLPGQRTCALIFFANSKSSHDVSTLSQLSLADLTQSPLACPMSWIPPNLVPVLCKAQATKAPPALVLAQGLQVRYCFRAQS